VLQRRATIRNVRPRRPGSEAGFTYLALLFMVIILGVTLSATGVIWHSAAQRDKERELLFIGEQFRQAIRSYYLQTPGGVKRFPPRLGDLIKDPRFAGMRRHLRQIYVDPMTGTKEWGLIKAPDGGIMGVFSQSEDRPIRVSFEHPLQRDFAEKTKYREWKFVYLAGFTSDRSRPLP
jgi:type II secretory pathway pseudopilin PulG